MLNKALFVVAKLENNISVQFQLYLSDIVTRTHVTNHLQTVIYISKHLF